jgi:hypothetical protein
MASSSHQESATLQQPLSHARTDAPLICVRAVWQARQPALSHLRTSCLQRPGEAVDSSQISNALPCTDLAWHNHGLTAADPPRPAGPSLGLTCASQICSPLIALRRHSQLRLERVWSWRLVQLQPADSARARTKHPRTSRDRSVTARTSSRSRRICIKPAALKHFLRKGCGAQWATGLACSLRIISAVTCHGRRCCLLFILCCSSTHASLPRGGACHCQTATVSALPDSPVFF